MMVANIEQTYKTTVSLCVVALNEENYIEKLLQDFVNQDYPHDLIEVVLVDSGSKDKTKELMESFSKNSDFRKVKVVDNPKRIQASGWNVAIKNSECDVITRIDAHTHIPFDFVSKNIKNIDSGEYISGGTRPCLIENDTLWGRILLRTENSLFGSGINKSKYSTEKQYVKTMFHASYRREVFDKSGLFNENLLRTEDNEMHYRMRKNGYKFCYDPQIISYQYARNSFRKMIKQKYGNGYWIGLTVFVCPKCLSIYHFIPFCFLGGILLFSLFAIFLTIIPLIVLMGMYLCFAIVNTIFSSFGDKFNKYMFLMPILFFILHISYGVGTLVGILNAPFKLLKKDNNRVK